MKRTVGSAGSGNRTKQSRGRFIQLIVRPEFVVMFHRKHWQGWSVFFFSFFSFFFILLFLD